MRLITKLKGNLTHIKKSRTKIKNKKKPKHKYQKQKRLICIFYGGREIKKKGLPITNHQTIEDTRCTR
jgi:hypothetical protein